MERPGDHKRFDLAPHSMPDMICGVNGEKLTQAFRLPTSLPSGPKANSSKSKSGDHACSGTAHSASANSTTVGRRPVRTVRSSLAIYRNPSPIGYCAAATQHGLNLEH